MSMKAIAAISLNRVIGKDGKMPWHIPADFKWFRQKTLGHAVLMGRKTWESLEGPLPGRRNLVATRGPEIPGVEIVPDLGAFSEKDYPCDVWVIGGADIYREMMPRCDELYLTVIPREVEGDVFFPPFEDQFELVEVVRDEREYQIRRYRRKKVQ